MMDKLKPEYADPKPGDKLEQIKRDFGDRGPGVCDEDIWWLIKQLDDERALLGRLELELRGANVSCVQLTQGLVSVSGPWGKTTRKAMAYTLADAVRMLKEGGT